jgi:hypothetical protein
MPQTALSVRLQAIDEHLARLRAEKSRLLARASQMERKREIRRKIVIGNAILSALGEAGVPPLQTSDDLRLWLDARLTRPSDRVVFELPLQESVTAETGL